MVPWLQVIQIGKVLCKIKYFLKLNGIAKLLNDKYWLQFRLTKQNLLGLGVTHAQFSPNQALRYRTCAKPSTQHYGTYMQCSQRAYETCTCALKPPNKINLLVTI